MIRAAVAALAALALAGCDAVAEDPSPAACVGVPAGRATLERLERAMARGEEGPLTRSGLDAAWEDQRYVESLCDGRR